MSDGIVEFPGPADGVPEELVAALEALLFSCGEPIGTADLARALELDPAELRPALKVLEQRTRDGGVTLARVAGGWQLRTAARFAEAVTRLQGARPRKLSPASLEVLAVVAYQQPVTKPEVDRIRGVDSGGVLKGLLDRRLVRVAGRSSEPGRPIQYKTTPAFLELFSLPDLAALPTLQDREELGDASSDEGAARTDGEG